MWGADAATTVGVLAVVVVGLALVVVFDSLFMSVLWRHEKGRFEVTRNDRNAFKFRGDFGDFTIDRTNDLLRYTSSGESGEVPLGEIERLDFAFRLGQGKGRELLNGLDWWDLTARYEDRTQCYQIAVITPDLRLPIFEVSQWLPREPLMSRVFDSQAHLLARMGLFEDVEERAHDVLTQLQEAFAAAGHPLTLTPKWAKDRAAAISPATQSPRRPSS